MAVPSGRMSCARRRSEYGRTPLRPGNGSATGLATTVQRSLVGGERRLAPNPGRLDPPDTPVVSLLSAVRT